MKRQKTKLDNQSKVDKTEVVANRIKLAEENFRRLQGKTKKKLISFVIPVLNEEQTLVELRDGIEANIPDGYTYELIFVDDGSTDSSWRIIQAMAEVYPDRVRGLKFRANKGKATGLTAGFRAARGEIVFTMDADLQDDPVEIPRFLEKLDEGYDVVGGYKKVRRDPWPRVVTSRVFNWMLSHASKVKLHDHNCGFKCFRANVIKDITLYGEHHRLIPSLVGMKGFRCTEIVVKHHARKTGVSKYGVERFFRGFSDMLTIGFLNRFRERPSHFMNACALFYFMVAMGLGISSIFTGFMTSYGLILTLFSMTFGAIGTGIFLVGLLSEQVIRGGNQTDWNLSIIEDTAEEYWSPRKQNPMLKVPVEYSVHENGHDLHPIGPDNSSVEIHSSKDRTDQEMMLVNT